MNISIFIITALTACGGQSTTSQLDAEYSVIMRSLGAAERDNTKNIKDRGAQLRLTESEQGRIAFFQDPENTAAIEAAIESEDSFTAARGSAYALDALMYRSWTNEEKAREQELLADLQRIKQREVAWISEDGETEIQVNRSWGRVVADASHLSAEQMEALTAAWVDTRTDWMGDELEELIRLRNEIARREGFNTYWELALAHRGLSIGAVDEITTRLTEIITPINRERQETIALQASELGVDNNFSTQPAIRKASGVLPDAVALDAEYDADLVESRINDSMAAMGAQLNGVSLYTGPSRYTRPGAYGYPINPPHRIAVVMSQDSRWSSWSYRALSHEMGLAFWWSNLPEAAAESPVMWEPPSPWLEGIGQLFERIAMSGNFATSTIDGFPTEIANQLDDWHKIATVDSINWYLGSSQMERLLYESPGQWAELSRASAAIETELLGITWGPPLGSNGNAYPKFLQSSLMLHYPAYVQNYLFATTTEATLWHVVSEAIGEPVGNPEVGPWLIRELINPVSAGTSFEARLEELSGDASATAALSQWLSSD